MATTKNPTKRDNYKALLEIPAVAENEQLKAFIDHEIELLDAKNLNRKPSKKQVEKQEHDAELRQAIVNEMEMGHMYSAEEMTKTLPTLMTEPDLKPAKVTYLMQTLVKDGSVVRIVDKRKTYYQLSE